jgi:hypothetical protein
MLVSICKVIVGVNYSLTEVTSEYLDHLNGFSTSKAYCYYSYRLEHQVELTHRTWSRHKICYSRQDSNKIHHIHLVDGQ